MKLTFYVMSLGHENSAGGVDAFFCCLSSTVKPNRQVMHFDMGNVILLGM